jgi:hypothetical protein
MKRKFNKHQQIIAIGIMLIAILLGAFTRSFAQGTYPTGVTIYDPSRAYNSYIIFSSPDNKTHLIDLDGNEVHSWNYIGFPGELLDPAVTGGKKGEVLVQYESIASKGITATPGQNSIFSNKSIAELDWLGNVVWKFGDKAPGGTARQHHDWQRLANGNTLVLANQLVPIPGFKLPKLLDDVVYEVNPAGDIVWTWKASDHLTELGFTDEQLQLVKNTSNADYFHVNNMTSIGPNKWYEKGDERFNPDNILIDSRNANFIIIIDKKTGKVVWNLGPNFAKSDVKNDSFPRPVDQISGQHDAHLIEEGLPGAGDLIVFDNQGEAGYPSVPLQVLPGSRVLEINPVTKQIVWEYNGESSGKPSWTFYSAFISSARRLPNGNTLIDEGMHGRFFQVTPAGEIVWEYVSPYFDNSPIGGVGKSVYTNWVYRAQPVPYNWVPDGTPHSEIPVKGVDITKFTVPK